MQDSDLTLSLEREGEFSVRWTESNDTQCGPTKLTDIMIYKAKITMNGAMLDDNGFIVDNMFIHYYFLEKYKEVRIFESCERIAIAACKDLKEKIGERLMAVEVMIAGTPQARLTARCNFAEALDAKEMAWPTR